jgi:hypothetical protein
MIRQLLSVCALSMSVAGPALAVGANCEDQLAAIKIQLADRPDARTAVDAKYTEAERLCNDKKDRASQALTQEIQEQLAQTGEGAGVTSGSSAAKPDSK